MTINTPPNSYDEVPYPSLAYALSHPDHLATLATLLGMSPAAIDCCRVLELGCASGGNLIPMAYGLPESLFTGLDFSAGQIADGEAIIKTLGLKNITLKHMNILDVTPHFGQFDYIIVHGVYSWVQPPVQDKILEICQQNLAPNGVAYVSYNTYPGWYMLRMVREMMLYHTRAVTDPYQRAAGAQQLLNFLAEAASTENRGYGSFLQAYDQFRTRERAELLGGGDAVLLHDELESVNEPVYFYQFIERAASHGLQYLAEAKFPTMLPGNFPAPVAQALAEMAKSAIDLEQYMDFVRNRTFRQTLLCHQNISLRRTLNPGHLAPFLAASPARPVASRPDIASVTVEKFRAPDGTMLTTDHPVTKAAMLYLAEIWPQATPFNSLLATARARLNLATTPEQVNLASDLSRDAEVLGTNLLMAYSSSNRLVELRLYQPDFTLQASHRPVASAVARLQVQQGSRKVTNLRHERVNLNELNFHLLPYLDGDHDQAELLAILAELAVQGTSDSGQEKQAPETTAKKRPEAMEELKLALYHLAHLALLVG